MADIAEVTIQIRASAEGVDTAVQQAQTTIKAFAANVDALTGKIKFDPIGNMPNNVPEKMKPIRDEADKAALAFAALAAAAKTAFDGITGAINSGIEASQKYTSALMGLNSVATGKGIGAEEMQAALDGVTDAFFSTTEASTAFKNLLSRGYSIDQATQTIQRLKEAASFGRQANLGFAQSIVTATEGIKNENSVLVDNAGVTKNVAKMWESYAKARGLATTELTQAQKVEAEYLGIMEETALQVGDFSKMTQTLAGDQATAAQKSMEAMQSFGDAMTPIVSAGEQLKAGFLGVLTEIVSTAPGLTAGFTGAGAAMTAFIAAASGLSTVKKLMDSLSISSAMLGPLAAAAAAVGVLVAGYTALKKAQEESSKAEEERKAAIRESVATEQGRLDRLRELRTRYAELSSRESLTISESAEMAAIVQELAKSYGIQAEKVGDAADAQERYNAAMAAAEGQTLDELYSRQNEATWESIKAAKEATKGIFENIKRANELKEKASEYTLTGDTDNRMFQLAQWTSPRDSKKAQAEWYEYLDGAVKALEARNLPVTFEAVMDEVVKIQKQKLGESEGLFDEWIGDHLDQHITDLARKGIEVPPELVAGMKTALQEAFSAKQLGAFDAFGGIDAAIRSSLEAVTTVVQDSEIQEAVKGLVDSMADAQEGLTLDSETIAENWEMVFGEESPLMTSLMNIPGMTQEVAAGILEMALGLEGLAGTSESAVSGLNATAAAAATANSSVYNTASGFDYLNSSAKDWNKQQQKLITDTKSLNDRFEEGSRKQKVLTDGMTALQKAQKSGSKLTQAEEASVESLRKEFGKAGDSYEVLAEKGKRSAAALETEMSGVQAEAQGLTGDFLALEASADVRGDVQVDTAAAESALNSLLALARSVLAVLAALGAASGEGAPAPKSGGGGGGKKDDKEAKKREAEQARRDALQADYRMIEHRRRLNEISFEQEIRMLNELRDKHRLNAEEIMEWEEKVYALKQEIRQRDAGSIDTVGDALITALTARYQAMLDAEVERLDASRKAWEEWRDGSVRAIQDQIDALDQLAKTEDREKQDQEELRKIAKIRQDIEFEQDDYNRMKLQQQLEQAIESREERLRRLALEDAKDALRAEITAINERAEAEIKALDEEQKAIEAAYEQQMKGAAIQAEAEKMLMANNQKEIISLIGEYAPEYNALGKTLGEKLLDGFQAKFGSVVSWFESLNKKLYSIQKAAASEAIAASNALYTSYADNQNAGVAETPATIVNQTVQFYDGVDSAGEAARKLQQVNEELGALING